MQDLNTIARLNAESSAREIPSLVAAGKHVIVKHDGLHYQSHTAFDSREAANDALQDADRTKIVGERVELRSPVVGTALPPGISNILAACDQSGQDPAYTATQFRQSEALPA